MEGTNSARAPSEKTDLNASLLNQNHSKTTEERLEKSSSKKLSDRIQNVVERNFLVFVALLLISLVLFELLTFFLITILAKKYY